MADRTIDLNGNDKTDNDQPLKSKKKKNYTWLILIIIIGLVILFIKLDIGKISSKYIAPTLENVPIVNNILPKTQEEGPYASYTEKQLIDIITNNELQLEEAKQEIESQILEIVALEKKIENLAVFEEEYVQFKAEKQLFDESVGTMNPEEFSQFYQQMYPENAKEVYAEIVQVQQMTKEQRKYASLISEMDQTRAAKVLENLFQTDMDIILSILSNMDTESASAILAEMDSKIASIVVKQLSPE